MSATNRTCLTARDEFPEHMLGWEPYLTRYGIDAEGSKWTEFVRYAESPQAAVEDAHRVAEREGMIVLSVAWNW